MKHDSTLGLATLEVSHQRDDRYTMRWTPGSVVAEWGGTGVQILPVRTGAKIVEVHRKQIDKTMMQWVKGEITDLSKLNDKILMAGKGLYDAFLSEKDPQVAKLRAELEVLKCPLQLSIDMAGVQWELFHDGDEFWGLKYSLGRSLLASYVPEPSGIHNLGERCLLVADPDPDDRAWGLPGASREGKQLVEWFKGHEIEVDILIGNDATIDEVVTHLTGKAYDFIYFACHGVWDPNSKNPALRLHGGDLLDSTAIRGLVKGAPVVSLTACSGVDKEAVGESGSGFRSVAEAFIAAGALAVVGSLFDVSDIGSRTFAEVLFSSLLDGETIGRSMQKARLYLKGQTEDELLASAWPCFVLYGDPRLQLFQPKAPIGEDAPAEDYEPAARLALFAAAAYANARTQSIVSTNALLCGMMHSRKSLLNKRLGRFGIADKLREIFEIDAAIQADFEQTANLENELYRENAKLILQEARTEAQLGGRPMSEMDLLNSFVQVGGGGTGKLLNSIGIDLEVLTSKAFNDDGTVSMEAFDRRMQSLIRSGIEVAGIAGPVLGRRHLLHAMLSDKHGRLAAILRDHNAPDAEILADKLYAELTMDSTPGRPPRPRIGAMSSRLVRVFCWAASDIRDQVDDLVGDVHILRAMAKDGGEVIDFLSKYGVRRQWLQ